MLRGVPSATIVAGILALPPCASGQATFELIRFDPGAAYPIGRLVEGPDGSLYGMTFFGERYRGGTVFALRPSGTDHFTTEIVHTFGSDFENGSNPWGSLILGRDGNLYGMTTRNPSIPPGPGTVFRMTFTGELTTLHNFSSGDGGHMPVWRLLEASDGNFYGCTCGGTDSTIFSITPTGTFTPLFRLFLVVPTVPYWYLGVCPVTELKEGPDGLLYGQATYGGPFNPVLNGGGTLFQFNPHAPSYGDRFRMIRGFPGPGGVQPVGGLVTGPGGDLYGSLNRGGALDNGAIFRMNLTGETATVHEFQGPEGARPYGGLFPAADGALYGTTMEGGFGYGTLFKIDADGRFSLLHAFTAAEGDTPVEVMQARDGRFYGVTYFGGPAGAGTVYRWAPGGSVETLHTFNLGPMVPLDGVIQAADGNLYGTATGSAYSGSTVFKVGTGREISILHDFGVGENLTPSGLLQASDGFLYGTTFTGGAQNLGTAFRVSTTGGYSLLHSFMGGAERHPEHAVIQGSDGFLYGTAVGTGAGVVFRMDALGNVTIVYALEGTAAYQISGPLVEGADGSLYGMTNQGGPSNFGTLFKVTTSGDFTILHLFAGDDGRGPIGGLTKAADGRLYGVTGQGGAGGSGTLFRMEAGGGVTTLHSFSPTEGFPYSVLVGRDGALYGVSVVDYSTMWNVFRFSAAGFEILYTSNEADGAGFSRLMQGSDGAFYGTVRYFTQGPSFGPTGGGGVFRLAVSP
jgi:uncharacterized repeat protein (TIGR03803 family)